MQNIDIEQLRKLIESNPSLFSQPQTKLQTTEKKKAIPQLKDNTVIEIPQQNETIQYISKSKAKKLMEEAGLKRTRKISDEQRAQLLENLAKGREKLKEKQQAQKAKKLEQVQSQPQINNKPKVIKVGENVDTAQPVIKYVVKGRRLSNPKKYIKQEEESDEEIEPSSESELSSLTSESESDSGKIIRKIKKKIKEIKKVDNSIKKIIQPSQSQPIQQPNKQVYNLWYR